jgi:hypothetical protein
MTDTSARAHSDNAATTASVSRRQLVKAGAWAAPAIILTTAVPAATASVVGTVRVSRVASTVQNGRGNERIHTVTVTLTNSGSQNAVGVSVNATVGTASGTVTGGPTAVTIPAGGTATATFTWTTMSGGSQTFSVTLPTSTSTWTYTGAALTGLNGNTPLSYSA